MDAEAIIRVGEDANGKIREVQIKKLPIQLLEKDGAHIVYSQNFKIHGYSRISAEDAYNRFETALRIFFDVHVEDKTLNRALIHFGFNRDQDEFAIPVMSPLFNQQPNFDFQYAAG